MIVLIKFSGQRCYNLGKWSKLSPSIHTIHYQVQWSLLNILLLPFSPFSSLRKSFKNFLILWGLKVWYWIKTFYMVYTNRYLAAQLKTLSGGWWCSTALWWGGGEGGWIRSGRWSPGGNRHHLTLLYQGYTAGNCVQ